MWLFAGLERDLAEPGEYLVLNIGDESLLVSRTDEGDLAAFYNVCQHRDARIMVNERGWVRDFVCPYHGWTYDHAGTLTVVPDADRFTPPVDCAALSLQQIRVETFSDMVFVCIDPDAPSLFEFLGPLVDIIAPFDLAGMSLIGDQTVHLDANWKAVFDNFAELYHVEHIHPHHRGALRLPDRRDPPLRPGPHRCSDRRARGQHQARHPDEPTVYQRMALERYGADPAAYTGHILDIRADVQRLRRQEGPRLGYDYDRDHRRTTHRRRAVQPVPQHDDHTATGRCPDHAGATTSDGPEPVLLGQVQLHRQPDPKVAERAGVVFTPHPDDDRAPAERPEHDEFTQDDIIAGRKTMTITIDQDIHLIRDVQAGMRSRGFSTARLCDDEARVQHYHDWLGHHLGLS